MLDIVRRALPPGKLLGKGKEEVLMKDWQKLSHVKWGFKYHIVFVTKYRKRKVYGEIRKEIGSIIRQLCDQKGILLHEGHAMSDHIQILVHDYHQRSGNHKKMIGCSLCEHLDMSY